MTDQYDDVPEVPAGTAAPDPLAAEDARTIVEGAFGVAMARNARTIEGQAAALKALASAALLGNRNAIYDSAAAERAYLEELLADRLPPQQQPGE
jgi:hypothetical protein